jgi:biotin synthase-related radical SAM superfamily protein
MSDVTTNCPECNKPLRNTSYVFREIFADKLYLGVQYAAQCQNNKCGGYLLNYMSEENADKTISSVILKQLKHN